MPRGYYIRKPRGPYPKQPIQERFEKHIYFDPMSGCWLWIGARLDNGYGIFEVFKNRLAHRVSWEINKGPIPNGLHVCHRCDVRLCVNPYHLFLGTRDDNMQDAIKKGRIFNGERHPNVKLIEKEVRDIREDIRPQHVIARDYGVCQPTIAMIKTHKIWKHI